MVINSNFWKSHFLSGEKKRVPPGGHGLAWLSPASAGEKNGCPKSSQIRDPGRPWQPSQNAQNTKKTLGKQGILENVEILVATEIPRNLKTLGKTRYSGQTRIPPGGGNRKKPYKTNRKLGILLKSGFHLEAEIAKNLIKPIENGVFCSKADSTWRRKSQKTL